MIEFGWIIGVVVFGLPMAYAVLRVVGELRAEARVEKKVAATRRTEVIDRKEYSVVTRTLPIVREKRTGRIGIAMERGAENDPTTVNGKLALEPRWIRVQFIRKSDGKFGIIGWRKNKNFETVGTVDLDFFSRRKGPFLTNEFIRCPTNLYRLYG